MCWVDIPNNFKAWLDGVHNFIFLNRFLSRVTRECRKPLCPKSIFKKVNFLRFLEALYMIFYFIILNDMCIDFFLYLEYTLLNWRKFWIFLSLKNMLFTLPYQKILKINSVLLPKKITFMKKRQIYFKQCHVRSRHN